MVSQTECTGMPRASTSSSYPSSLGNVVRSKGRGLSISKYALAIRFGVSAVASLSDGTPSAARKAAAARSAAARSVPSDSCTTRRAA